MTLSQNDWNLYVKKLSTINKKAGALMAKWIQKYGTENKQAMIDYAYALITKYGESSAALACQIYDEIVDASGVAVALAEPAETATVAEVAKSINGVAKVSDVLYTQVVEKWVKQASADTILYNAKRDGAEAAWIPSGDSCPYCLGIAGLGWLEVSKKVANGKHADHIHANCDCNYAIRFSDDDGVKGYNPSDYPQYMTEGDTNAQINELRRQNYADNKEKINEQHRIAYAKRQELKNNS